MSIRASARFAVLCGLLVAAGCGVRREIVVDSDPPGALVYLNNEEVGRTPLRHDFVWYGNYDVQLRKEGYETIDTTQWVTAPWWQWPPFDLIAEIVPGRPLDEHHYAYVLKPSTQPVDPEAFLKRAEGMRGQLQTSENPRVPTTQQHKATTTKPATKPTK